MGNLLEPEKLSISINTKDWLDDTKFKCSFAIHAPYSRNESIHHITAKITEYLENKYDPLKFQITLIDADKSFIEQSVYNGDDEYDALINESITKYSKNDIVNKGLNVDVQVYYKHNVLSSAITCEYMVNKNSDDPLQCPIYFVMKEQYKFSEQNLNHINSFCHFMDEYGSKPSCKYKDECKSYIRLQSGIDHKLCDLCHIKLYKHPPRKRNIKLSQNINSLIINKKKEQNNPSYDPTQEDKKKYNITLKDGCLNALILEVISNGYRYDLCLQCGANDDCKHDDYSILQIVHEKMESIRHKSMDSPLSTGEMLSLILYTGCDCNYDLCSSQRSGDYTKWKWFDYCLWNGIYNLSIKESGSFSVFSGINKVKLDKKFVEKGYFVTYVSTTWRKQVSVTFLEDEGMIIQIDQSFKDNFGVYCCDVSWISKFPDECEVLFARSTDESDAWDGFKCVVVDESNGIQTVALTKQD